VGGFSPVKNIMDKAFDHTEQLTEELYCYILKGIPHFVILPSDWSLRIWREDLRYVWPVQKELIEL